MIQLEINDTKQTIEPSSIDALRKLIQDNIPDGVKATRASARPWRALGK